MNKKMKYLLIISTSLLLLVLIPFIVDYFIINNNYYSKASNDGWASFFGSYFGGILGGFGTLAGVLITLKENRKETIKPFLVIDFDEIPKEIYWPENYSKLNKTNRIFNFYEVPLISEIFDINIRNTGKGYAKNINITMLIKISDALVTDDNLFWMSRNPIDIERIDIYDDSYAQQHVITYIGGEGEKKLLPINSTLNGIILCSLWNINNFLSLEDNDFQKTKEYYDIKKNKMPLTIPDIRIYLQYYDLDNNKYESVYKVGFNGILQSIGSHTLVKAKLDFESELSSIKKEDKKAISPPKKKKAKKITRKMKQTLLMRKEWSNNVYEFGIISLGLSDIQSKSISKDNAILRYFFLAYDNEMASLEQLIITVAVCCYDKIDIRKFSSKKIINLHEKLRDKLLYIIKDNNKNKYSKIINKEETNYNKINDLSRLKRVLKSEKEIFENYFKSYEKNNGKENQMIHIYNDGKNGINIKVNIANRGIKTELGFFRMGFNYRKVENIENNLIVSAIAGMYKNEEVGFLNESGAYFENDNEWKCIYLR